MMHDEEDEMIEPVVYDISHRSTRWIRILAVLCVVLGINAIVSNTIIYKGSYKYDGMATMSARDDPYPPTFRPLPPEDTVLTSIAFGSCASQLMPQPYWDTLVNFAPNITLLMGDNVYGDCETEGCPELRQAYRDFAKHPSLQGAAPQLSVMATLDDHDYGMNDANKDNPNKDLARELFAEFFRLETDVLPEDGVYHSRVFGSGRNKVQIIFLDIRYSKDPFERGEKEYTPSNSTEVRMLSEKEWTWLEGQLQVPADLRLLVSSIQVLNDVTEYGCWRHFPFERQRLYDMIRDQSVIILSGDRHMGGFYESEDGLLREVTSSSWTHTVPLGLDGCEGPDECDEADPRRIGDFVRENHFGLIEIDWVKRRCTVSLRRTDSSVGVVYFEHQKHKEGNDGVVLAQQEYQF